MYVICIYYLNMKYEWILELNGYEDALNTTNNILKNCGDFVFK